MLNAAKLENHINSNTVNISVFVELSFAYNAQVDSLRKRSSGRMWRGSGCARAKLCLD